MPQLYSRFSFYGDKDRFSKIWCFLHTIVEKPTLASLVKHLDVQGLRYDVAVEPFLKGSKMCIRMRELETFYALGYRAGYIDSELAHALLINDPMPFVILLISLVPKLLSFRLSHAEDRYMSAICKYRWRVRDRDVKKGRNSRLDSMLSRQGFFQDLSEATFFCSPRTTRWLIPVGIGCANELYLLPALQKLSLMGVDIETTDIPDDPRARGISNITSLILVLAMYEEDLEEGKLTSFLQLPKALVSLTLTLWQCHDDYDLWYNYPIGNCRLLEVLSQHKHSLEYLDLHHAASGPMTCGCRPRRGMSPLNDFEQLHTLRIGPDTLIGCRPDMYEVRLAETLPKHLRSLTFYKNWEFNE